jgi:hypothetical protein
MTRRWSRKLEDGLKRLDQKAADAASRKYPKPPDFGSAGDLAGNDGREKPLAPSPERGRADQAQRSALRRSRPDQGEHDVVDQPELARNVQKKLDEKMAAAADAGGHHLRYAAPRPMRLPRSIAPSQWLEFLESHLTLFLATLEAQGINIRTSINLEDAPATMFRSGPGWSPR